MEPIDETFRKRCKRYDVEGHAHYLTFSCLDRRPLLNHDSSRRWLLDSLLSAREKHHFELWAFVIMPEHAHVLLLPAEGSDISRILYSIKKPVTAQAAFWAEENCPEQLSLMRSVRPDGSTVHHFWLPGGGYDRNIWSVEELHEKIHYIHNNPVRRTLVASPGDWPWSSWRAWEEGVAEPIPIDRESLPPIQM
jgi:putative transposase